MEVSLINVRETDHLGKGNFSVFRASFVLMPNADTQCTVVGREEEAKGQRKFFCLNFPCLAIKCDFISRCQLGLVGLYCFYNPPCL